MQVSHKQHFLNAACFWTLTGAILGFVGFKWLWSGFAQNSWVWLLVALAVLLGWAKGEFMIGKAGKKAIERIHHLPECSSFHRVFTPGQWVFVFSMMGIGMLIRFSGLDKSYRGIILAVVGVGLLWASRYFWEAANREKECEQ